MNKPHVLVALVATLITVPTARADDTYRFRGDFLAYVLHDAVTFDFEQAGGFPAAVPAPAGLVLLAAAGAPAFRRRVRRGSKTMHETRRLFIGRIACAPAAAAAVVLSAAVGSSALAAGSLTPLGDLPGGTFRSVARGVSDDGSVVVGGSSSALIDGEAFRWTSAGGMVGLGRGNFQSGTSAAYAVSGDGTTVVGERQSGFGELEAFRWTSGGGLVGLGYAPPTVGSNARGVNRDGSVVVGFAGGLTRWTSAGGWTGLGSGPGGIVSQNGYDVSADGSVIVGAGFISGTTGQGYRWTSAGGIVGIGEMPVGLAGSDARGVSDDGSVVVGTSSFVSGAYRWTSGGGMVGLGDLPGGLIGSYADAVSGDGSVVVGYSYSSVGQEAMLWTEAGGIQSLWDVLLAQGVNPAASGWTTLDFAHDVSANGSAIVGEGLRNGNREAFVAVVPEPAGLLLPASAALAALRRRRRPKSDVTLSTPLISLPSRTSAGAASAAVTLATTGRSMHKVHVLGVLVATSLLVAVPTARADDTYRFRGDFLAYVLHDAVTFDFEQAGGFPAAVAPISTFGGGAIQVSSVGGSAFVGPYFAPNQALTGGLNGVLNELQPVHLVFAQPVFGVGFDDMALTPQLTEVAVIKITRADNSTGTFIAGNVEDVITPVFFGVTSPLGIVALDVYSASAPNSPPGGRANLIDNLVVSPAVPEPAGVAAAAGGLMALSRRRRRRPGNERNGIGGGISINAAADADLDTFAARNTTGNTASTSSPNIAGSYRRLR